MPVGNPPTVGVVRKTVPRSQIPVGRHKGQWSGYVLSFMVGDDCYTADVDMGVRGTVSVVVTVDNEGAVSFVEKRFAHVT